MTKDFLMRRIRRTLALFITLLVLSGLTAFPLLHEVRLLARLFDGQTSPLALWIRFVLDGLEVTYAKFPFFGYGTDWLAYAHIVVATFFLYAYRDPVRNRDMIDAGIIACLLLIPTALVCGEIREIP